MIIAIDGPAASGKGTLGKRLAAHYGLRHLDTGLLYRAVAKAVVDRGLPLDDKAGAIAAARALDPSGFDEKVLKAHAVGEATIGQAGFGHRPGARVEQALAAGRSMLGETATAVLLRKGGSMTLQQAAAHALLDEPENAAGAGVGTNALGPAR